MKTQLHGFIEAMGGRKRPLIKFEGISTQDIDRAGTLTGGRDILIKEQKELGGK